MKKLYVFLLVAIMIMTSCSLYNTGSSHSVQGTVITVKDHPTDENTLVISVDTTGDYKADINVYPSKDGGSTLKEGDLLTVTMRNGHAVSAVKLADLP
jgi:hypothetical protein